MACNCARDWLGGVARRRAASDPVHVPTLARAVAGGHDDSRIRLDRARVGERPGPELTGARGGGLLGHHADRDCMLRHERLAALRRGLLRLLQLLLPDLSAARARPHAPAAAPAR